MKPRDIVFVVIVVFVVGGLYFLSTRARTPRAMPANPAHLNAVTRDQCLACHQPEKLAELEKAHRHPGKWKDEKVSCLQCHHVAATPGRALLDPAKDRSQRQTTNAVSLLYPAKQTH